MKNGKFYVPAWVTRGVGLAVNSILLMQITFYATESVGLSAGVVGTLLLVSKLFDGITDLIAGFIIDKTHTRWGKAIYIFILYLLINAVCVTFLSASEAVFMARSTSDDNRRAHALTAAGICAMIFPAAISIVLPFLMASWGTQPGGWTKIALVLGIPAIIMVGAIFGIQCMDYGEWKTGIRVEGMINAVGGFATKVGSGLASGLVGLVMGMTGYVGGASTQTASANTAIVWCFSLIPTILCVGMFILCSFYDLEKKIGKIREELAERNAQK